MGAREYNVHLFHGQHSTCTCTNICFSQKCLSESIEDMEAYLWVTDDVLNQIRALNPDNNENIKQAQRLIDRIYRRDFYKLIGEKRVKWKRGSDLLPVYIVLIFRKQLMQA